MAGTEASRCFARLRWAKQNHRNPERTTNAPTATPAPIPALAPVERPDDEEDGVPVPVGDPELEAPVPVITALFEDVAVATHCLLAAHFSLKLQHCPPYDDGHKYWLVVVQLRGQHDAVTVAVLLTVVVTGHS